MIVEIRIDGDSLGPLAEALVTVKNDYQQIEIICWQFYCSAPAIMLK